MGKTTKKFKDRKAFYDAVVATLNALYPSRAFQLRWNEASTAQQVAAGVRSYVEPGEWRLERSTKGTTKRIESVRVVIEGILPTNEETKAAIADSVNFLDDVGRLFIRNPLTVDGAFCSEAQAFNDAAPLYDPSSASDATPLLYAGLALHFWFVA